MEFLVALDAPVPDGTREPEDNDRMKPVASVTHPNDPGLGR